MEALLRIALWNVAGSAGLALLAWAVGRSFHRPALGHVLWFLALLKLLTPPLWTIGITSYAPAQPSGRPVAFTRIEAVAPRGPVIHRVPAREPWDSPRLTPATMPRQWLVPLALVIWAAGSLIYAAVAFRRVRQFLGALRYGASDERLQQRVDDLAKRIGLGRAPFAGLVPGRVCPMVWWALGRPRLLLPAALWAELDEPKRDTLILHELAHLKRRDHWVRIVELLATVLYWWDPLVWWVRREMRACEEQCCDGWVGWLMPASREAYAAALVDAIDFVSSSGSLSSPRLPALASGMGQFRHLQRRLVMIQQGTSDRRLGWAGYAITCAAAVVLPLSLTRGQSPSHLASGPSAHDELAASAKSPTTRPSASDESASAALYGRVIPEASFDGVSLDDVIGFLRDVTGANVFVNWKAFDAAGIDRNSPVTVHAKRVKFSKVLEMALTSAAGSGKGRLAYYFDRNVLTITSADDAGRATVTRVYNVRDVLPTGNAKDRYDDLIKAIETSVTPDSWRDNGGTVGSISPIDNMLVIVQTDENQRQVQDLLDKTRQARQEVGAQ